MGTTTYRLFPSFAIKLSLLPSLPLYFIYNAVLTVIHPETASSETVALYLSQSVVLCCAVLCCAMLCCRTSAPASASANSTERTATPSTRFLIKLHMQSPQTTAFSVLILGRYMYFVQLWRVLTASQSQHGTTFFDSYFFFSCLLRHPSPSFSIRPPSEQKGSRSLTFLHHGWPRTL